MVENLLWSNSNRLGMIQSKSITQIQLILPVNLSTHQYKHQILSCLVLAWLPGFLLKHKLVNQIK